MQKTIKHVMVTLVAIIAIAGCKKEINWNAKPDPDGNGCKLMSLKTNFGALGEVAISYKYDASGKLVSATSDNETMVYTYSATKITGMLPSGEKTELTLANGKAVSSYLSDFFPGVSATRTYTYNADGYVTVIKSYLLNKLNSTAELSYTGGNLTQIKVTYAEDGSIETTNYEYSSEIAVNACQMVDPISTIVDYIPGNYFGKASKNVLKKSVTISSDLINVETEEYSYVFDAKGNATSIVIKSHINNGGSANDTTTTTLSLVYNCK
ncbi:DUF4595 domain-containing protein [Pedobacter sp. SG908]|uniref:DUF4595 domain-containing protein n=1 Tax=Pedobacter sp. SG908 TaxID=2587135 RepID=UPI00141E7B48|nr:DUF4595 domain-containing protein [Pedobacter sp. SG908]NII85800.1 hypothetical protein [Pedobacter sp. SG908]